MLAEAFWEWLGKQPQGVTSFLGSLAGGGVGLIALVLGALFNAFLNRRRDDRLREIDRLAIAAALKAELTSILTALVENAESLEMEIIADPEDGGFLVPDVAQLIQLMPHMLPKIGLLGEDTVRKVIDAYLLVNQYFDRIMLLGGKIPEFVPPGRRTAVLRSGQRESVVNLNRSYAHPLELAIKVLTV
jgi:hypothetical protein